MRRYILTITCPDRVGIVAAVTGLIAGHGGSVLEAAQHGDLDSGRFFLRIEIVADSLPAGFGPGELAAAFEPVGADSTWSGTSATPTCPSGSCCSPARRTTASPTCCTAGGRASSSATSPA